MKYELSNPIQKGKFEKVSSGIFEAYISLERRPIFQMAKEKEMASLLPDVTYWILSLFNMNRREHRVHFVSAFDCFFTCSPTFPIVFQTLYSFWPNLFQIVANHPSLLNTTEDASLQQVLLHSSQGVSKVSEESCKRTWKDPEVTQLALHRGISCLIKQDTKLLHKLTFHFLLCASSCVLSLSVRLVHGKAADTAALE